MCSVQKDYARSGKISLAKALLEALAEDEKTTAFDLYCKYFESFCLVDEDSNLSCFQGREKAKARIQKHLFRRKFPEKDPCYFSFFSHHDVNRISRLTRTEILIYSTKDVKNLLQKKSSDGLDKVFVLHDFRCLAVPGRADKLKVFLHCTDSCKLYSLSEPLRLAGDSCFFGHAVCSDFKAEDDRNWISILDKAVLGNSDRPLSKPPTVKRLSEVGLYSGQLFKRWGEKNVLLVGFCRLYKKGSWEKKKNPADCYFVALALIHDSQALKPQATDLEREAVYKNCLVLAVYNDQQVCRVNQRFADSIFSALREVKGSKEKICGRIGPVNYRKITPLEREQAKKAWKETRKASAKKRKGDSVEDLFDSRSTENFKKKKKSKSSDGTVKLCKCSFCSDKTFDQNMSASGPEKLCSTDFSVSDLLKILGEWNPQVEETLEKLCYVSVAAMDIESRTVELDTGKSTDGNCFEYGEISAGPKMEGHVRKIQKPLMIAHSDGLQMLETADSAANLTEKTSGKGVAVFTVDSDSEESIYTMMKQYWDLVVSRQKKTREYKLKLAQPFYHLVNLYRKAFFDHSCEWLAKTSEHLKKKQSQFETKKRRSDGEAADDSPEEMGSPSRVDVDWNEDLDEATLVYSNMEIETLQKLCDKFEIKQEQLTAAWKATLPGKLETCLDRLMDQYEIFSFYG